uniref:Uncharacterized protein n=1 Tax=Panagrolaimus sp. JU765 TaxID=591449 RepID=A0AC34QY72_9BILA
MKEKLLPIIFLCFLWIIHVVVSGYGISVAATGLTKPRKSTDNKISKIDGEFNIELLTILGGMLIIFVSLPSIIFGFGNEGLFKCKYSKETEKYETSFTQKVLKIFNRNSMDIEH